MAFINKYPYSDFNEYNLDWIVKTIKDLTVEWAETKTEWSDMKTELEALKLYITTYFDNLDVQDEIDHKIDEMIADGSLAMILKPLVTSDVSNWLNDHVVQETGYVLDDTLSIQGAAADAESTGIAVNDLEDMAYSIEMRNLKSSGTEWVQGAANASQDTRSTAIKMKHAFYAPYPFIINITSLTSNYKVLFIKLSGKVVDNIYNVISNSGWKSKTVSIAMTSGYWVAQIEHVDGTNILPSDSSNVSFDCKFFEMPFTYKRLESAYNKELNNNSSEWINGAITNGEDKRSTAIKTVKGYYCQEDSILKINSVTTGYKILATRLNADPEGFIYSTTGWNSGWKTAATEVKLAGGYYYAFQIEKTNSTDITTSDYDKASFTLYSEHDSLQTELIVCGANAAQMYKDIAMEMKKTGRGYICENNAEMDTNINTFLDSWMNTECTVHFYGLIYASEGIHKHPKHSFIGHQCRIRMGDNLGDDYKRCIFPTNGGVEFEDSQVVSHNKTFVQGFTLDGNAANNYDGVNYICNSLYGGVISGEIYHETEYPYSRTQLISDIILRDLYVVRSLRGIIMGIGWTLEDSIIEDAFIDHAIYLAGADHAYVNNVKISGDHHRGTIAISGQSWDTSRKVSGIRLENLTLTDCLVGPYIDIRGHFSDWGNDMTLDDVSIDHIHITNSTNRATPVFRIGTLSNSSFDDPTDYTNYPHHIVINDVYLHGPYTRSVFQIYNAGVVISNVLLELTQYQANRPLFFIHACDAIKKMITLENFQCHILGTQQGSNYAIFAFNNDYAGHLVLNGLNISNAIIDGITNYTLFDLFDNTSTTNSLTIKDFVYDYVICDPDTVYGNALINVVPQEYLSLS